MMRRTIFLALAGVAISLTMVADVLASASAPNATAPSSVEKDKAFNITVQNCASTTFPPDGYVIVESEGTEEEIPAEVDGSTNVVHNGFSSTGAKQIFVSCEQDDAETGETAILWGPETLVVEVVAPTGTGTGGTGNQPTLTADERVKCKKIKNKKKRKKCLKREAAD
jgi:hypothetical protein